MSEKMVARFDTEAAEWFLEDGRCAGSLRELASLCGGPEAIEGYYPNGYEAVREGGGVSKRYVQVMNMQRPTRFVKTAAMRGTRGNPAVEAATFRGVRGEAKAVRDSLILDDWANGMLAHQIARKHGMRRPQTVSNIISLARAAGDPRAQRRGNGGNGGTRLIAIAQRNDRILAEWERGASLRQLAADFGFERWQTVAMIVYNARTKGDPRAVRRGNGGRVGGAIANELEIGQ